MSDNHGMDDLDGMDEVIEEFLIESQEGLDQVDQDLVELEQAPDSREILTRIFRTVHTIKGSCGFLGFSKLEAVAHAGENLLGKLRDGELQMNVEITSALLATADAIRQMLGSIEATRNDGDDDFAELVDTFKWLQEATDA